MEGIIKRRERERYEIDKIATEIVTMLANNETTKTAKKAQLALDRASDLVRAASAIDLTRL